MEDKKFWLDGFEGPVKGGLFVRSGIAREIADYEAKFNIKVVALGFEIDYESGKPSWNLELITEVSKEEVEKELLKARYPEVIKALATGTDEIHEAEEEEKNNGTS